MRLITIIFWCTIALNTIMSLIPASSVPDVFNFWDKAQHFLSFVIIAIIGCMAYPKSWKGLAVGLIAYGAAVEIAQGTLTATRFGDIFDLISDGLGSVAGIFICLTARRLLQFTKK